MQEDGNLVVYNFTDPSMATYTSQYALWAQDASPELEKYRSFLLLGGSGRLEYYSSNGTLRLNSTFNGSPIDGSTYPKFDPDSADYKPSRPVASLEEFPFMPAGYFLDAGKRLLAMSGQYSLDLGTDCNLQSKQHKGSGLVKVLWNSSTGSAENRSCRLSMGLNGSLVLSDLSQGTVIWSTNKMGASSVSWILKLDPADGSLTVSDITNITNVQWTNEDDSLPPEVAPLPPLSKSSQPVVWIVVGAVGGAFVLAAVVLGLCFSCRRSHVDPAEKAF